MISDFLVTFRPRHLSRLRFVLRCQNSLKSALWLLKVGTLQLPRKKNFNPWQVLSKVLPRARVVFRLREQTHTLARTRCDNNVRHVALISPGREYLCLCVCVCICKCDDVEYGRRYDMENYWSIRHVLFRFVLPKHVNWSRCVRVCVCYTLQALFHGKEPNGEKQNLYP